MDATHVRVTVQAFRQPTYAAVDQIGATFTYTVFASGVITVEAGAGDDRIVIDATLGQEVDLYGMAGNDQQQRSPSPHRAGGRLHQRHDADRPAPHLALLPVLDHVRQLAWVKAVMKGMGPAVIGVLAVSLLRLAPAALPDPFAAVILIGTIVATMAFRIGAFKVMIGGAVLGVLRSQLPLTALTRHL